MQISRHWRLNAQRYRLEGVRYEDGEVDLQERVRLETVADSEEMTSTEVERHAGASAAVPAA
ncbi:MAG: hypothetical protein ACOCX5_03010 [Chloroflexota bacterium]